VNTQIDRTGTVVLDRDWVDRPAMCPGKPGIPGADSFAGVERLS
jgi:hypothetical protein